MVKLGGCGGDGNVMLKNLHISHHFSSSAGHGHRTPRSCFFKSCTHTMYTHTHIYILRKYSRPQVSDVHSSVLTTRVSMFTIRCPWLKISNAPTWKEKAVVDAALGFGNSTRTRPLTRTSTSINIGSQPIHRLSAVRSSLGVRWSHGNLQLLRHPGLPALLQVIDLGANGGRLTTRRCHRRTNRAATTQAFPSERMLLRLRRSMTRLDPKRAAAAARCLTVQLEV